ncbi:MAG: OmpA family protein [Rhodobacterales bacterium]
MKPGFLKSSTAMVLVASLAAAPIPSFAQSADSDPAAQTDDAGQADLLRQQLQDAIDAQADVDAAAETPAAEPEPVPEVLPEPVPEVLPEPVPEPVTEPAPEPVPQNVAPEPEAAPEAPQADEPTPQAQTIPDAAPEAAQPEAAPEAAQPEVAPEAAQRQAVPEPATEAVEPDATPEVAPEAETSAPQAPIEPAAPEGEAADEPLAPADTAAEPQSDTSAESLEQSLQRLSDQNDGALETTAETAAETTPETAAQIEDVTPIDSQAQAEVQAEAEAQAPASLAASSDAAPAEAELVEETVTEDTARSSSEEFGTNLQGEAQTAPAAKKKDKKDDKGLSNFEKVALLGIGAVAIGTLLRKNETVAANTGDRVIAEQNGQFRVIKNDDALLRQPGSDIKTYTYSDGSTRTIVTREDGSEVETVRAVDGRVLRRARNLPDGTSALLFDDTQSSRAVDVSALPQISSRRSVDYRGLQADDLAAALTAAQAKNVNRTFSLSQIRNIDAVRKLVPEINVDSVNFATNSAVIQPQEAEALAALGNAMRRMIERNPSEVFLVEGHTDAVGAAGYNLALSDRRAESVALALTEYFRVPPENLVVQGYGESDLMLRTSAAERSNRRAAVRRITPLLDGSNG